MVSAGFLKVRQRACKQNRNPVVLKPAKTNKKKRRQSLLRFKGGRLYLHELGTDRLDVVVQEVWLQVVHAELKRAQALAYERLRAVERRHQRVHEHGQIGKQRAQPHGHGQTQLHKQILHVLLMEATLQHVQS